MKKFLILRLRSFILGIKEKFQEMRRGLNDFMMGEDRPHYGKNTDIW